MKTKHPTPRRGFTLIEIMMAMAIFGLVMAAIYSTWMAIIRGSQAGLKVAAQVQRERVAIHTIEQALTSARSFQGAVQHYGFLAENGSDATISFVAKLPRAFPRSGRFGDFDVRRVAFSVERGPDSPRQLVVRQCPILMDFDRDETEHPLVLAKNVKEFLLEFWDARANDWTDTWTQTNLLPKMVKVTLRMDTPNQSYSASTEKDEVMRIVALPSVAVPVAWQRAGGPGPNQPPNQRAGGPGPNQQLKP